MKAPIALHGIEVVIQDRMSGRLTAIYPYRDSDDSKVTPDSKNVLLLMCGVPGIDTLVLEGASKVTEGYVKRFCFVKRGFW